jgi:hypothetical protein
MNNEILKIIFCHLLKLAHFIITLIVPDKVNNTIGTNILTIVAKVGLVFAIDVVNPKSPIMAVIRASAIGSNKKYNAIIYFKFEK